MTRPSKIPTLFFFLIYGPNAVLAFAPAQGVRPAFSWPAFKLPPQAVFASKLRSDLSYCCMAGTYFWLLQLPGAVPRLTYSLEINCCLEHCLGPACLLRDITRKARIGHQGFVPCFGKVECRCADFLLPLPPYRSNSHSTFLWEP